MKMTESEKKEIERIQAKIMNTAAIIVGCAITIFAIWVFFIKGPDIDRSLREHAKYTTAYIEKIVRGRGGPHVTLIFKHDGKIYKIHKRYELCKVKSKEQPPIPANSKS